MRPVHWYAPLPCAVAAHADNLLQSRLPTAAWDRYAAGVPPAVGRIARRLGDWRDHTIRSVEKTLNPPADSRRERQSGRIGRIMGAKTGLAQGRGIDVPCTSR